MVILMVSKGGFKENADTHLSFVKMYFSCGGVCCHSSGKENNQGITLQ